MPAILRPRRGSATKTIGPNGVVRDYAAGKAFVGRNVTIPSDVATQADWLRGQVRRDEFFIAGDIRDGAADMRTIINRRYLALAGRDAPDIRDALQTQIFMDCDGVLGSCDFREDPVVAVASVRDMAPELKGVACVFVGSSQAGRLERVRGKYLFRLAAPKPMVELRTWAEDVNRRVGAKFADPALYNPVQPVYLAAPRFVGGASDPMPERVLVLPGDNRLIILPEPERVALALKCAPTPSLGLTQSALFNGFDLSENDDLTTGLFNFAEFKDAVERLADKGWFDRGEHEHMLRLAFACAAIAIKGMANADAVRELYFWVVDKTERDQVDNEARYDDALRRTQGLNSSGKIVTPGTVFHWAREQGWKPANETIAAHAAPFTSASAIELAVVKAKAIDAYKLGRLVSRERALARLSKFCANVADVDVRRELAKTVAAVLAGTAGPSE